MYHRIGGSKMQARIHGQNRDRTNVHEGVDLNQKMRLDVSVDFNIKLRSMQGSIFTGGTGSPSGRLYNHLTTNNSE